MLERLLVRPRSRGLLRLPASVGARSWLERVPATTVHRPLSLFPRAGLALSDRRHFLPSGAGQLQLVSLSTIPTAYESDSEEGSSDAGAEDYRTQHAITLHGSLEHSNSEPVLEFAALQRVSAEGRIPEPLPSSVHRYLDSRGFTSPSPIQAQSLPLSLAGRDLIAVAQTGSGKTLGFLLPLFWHVATTRAAARDAEPSSKRGRGVRGPLAIVLAPTRELAQQIEAEAQPLGRAFGCSSVCVFGGQDRRVQERAIYRAQRRLDLVVATPGRLVDFIQSGVLPTHAVQFLVCDEADRMLDMGFEPQLREIVESLPQSRDGAEAMPSSISGGGGQSRQTLMFSATWPKEVRSLASDFLSDPVRIHIGGSEELVANKDITQHVQLHETTFSKLDALTELVDQMSTSLKQQQQAEQLDRLASLDSLDPPQRRTERGGLRGRRAGREASRDGRMAQRACHTVVFVARKRDADMVAADIRDSCGVRAVSLHGDLSQSRRDSVLAGIKSGRADVLVATDVAARGLDVKTVKQVINYDMPTNMEDYVHRIGRTGRAGEKGEAHSFLNPKEDEHLVKKLCKVLVQHEQRIPEPLADLARKLSPRPPEHDRYRRGGSGRGRRGANQGSWQTRGHGRASGGRGRGGRGGYRRDAPRDYDYDSFGGDHDSYGGGGRDSFGGGGRDSFGRGRDGFGRGRGGRRPNFDSRYDRY